MVILAEIQLHRSNGIYRPETLERTRETPLSPRRKIDFGLPSTESSTVRCKGHSVIGDNPHVCSRRAQFSLSRRTRRSFVLGLSEVRFIDGSRCIPAWQRSRRKVIPRLVSTLPSRGRIIAGRRWISRRKKMIYELLPLGDPEGRGEGKATRRGSSLAH